MTKDEEIESLRTTLLHWQQVADMRQLEVARLGSTLLHWQEVANQGIHTELELRRKIFEFEREVAELRRQILELQRTIERRHEIELEAADKYLREIKSKNWPDGAGET